MQYAILILYDITEKKTVSLPTTDAIAKFLDKILGTTSTESMVLDCNCIRNNSMDRAKMLIRYLRNELKFEDEQIIVIRASRFKNAKEIRYALEYFLEKFRNDDVILYYTGHGITGKSGGWSFGGEEYILYKSLRKMLKKFSGRLAMINDCCHALAIDSCLKVLGDRYLLVGASRRGCVSSKSILDPTLGYWFHKMPADPRVALVGKWKDLIMDIPAYSSRGSNYNCGCGSRFETLKIFRPSNAPSLRRGAVLDHLFFPK